MRTVDRSGGRLRLALPLCVIILTACNSQNDAIGELAASLAQSIRSRDADAFLRAHVQEGDMTPSGGYWLAVKAGGGRPDQAWNGEVRRAFTDLTDRMKDAGVNFDSLELVKVENVTSYKVDGDDDRQNLSDLKLRLRDGRSEYIVAFGEGMLSKRGWVLVGDPVVTFTKE